MATTVLPTPDVRMADLRSNQPSETTAKAITSIGGLLLSADRQWAEAALDRSLEAEKAAYTNVVDRGQAGPQDITQDMDYRTYNGVRLDITENPQYAKALGEYQSKLDKNLAAHQQNKLSTLAFQARVEKLTRDAIAARPGLRRELTTLAAQTLGFDPTGVQLKQLMAAATKEHELSGIEKGKELEQVEMGKIIQRYMNIDPSVSEEVATERARRHVMIDNEKAYNDAVVGALKDKQFVTDAEAAAVVDGYKSNMYGEMQKLVYMAKPESFATQAGWDATVKGVTDTLGQAIGNIERDLKASAAWNNPGTREKYIKEMDAMRQDVMEFTATASKLWQDSIDAKTKQVNATMAREKLDALLRMKSRLRNYPEMYDTIVLTGGNILSGLVTTNASSSKVGADVSEIVSGADRLFKTADAIPAGGSATQTVEQRANDQMRTRVVSLYMDKGYKPGSITEQANKQAGAGFVWSDMYKTTAPAGMEGKQLAYMKEHAKAHRVGMTMPGGAVTLANGNSVRVAAIKPFDPAPMTTANEAAGLQMAESFSANPDKAKQDPELMDVLQDSFVTQLEGYATQFVNWRDDEGEGGKLVRTVGSLQLVEQNGVPMLAFKTKPGVNPDLGGKALRAMTVLTTRTNKMSTALIKAGYNKESVANYLGSVGWE